MNYHEMKKRVLSGPISANDDMIDIEDQARMVIDDIGSKRGWQAIGVEDSEGMAEIVALCHPVTATLLVHCTNNFGKALEALKQEHGEHMWHHDAGTHFAGYCTTCKLIAELEDVK